MKDQNKERNRKKTVKGLNIKDSHKTQMSYLESNISLENRVTVESSTEINPSKYRKNLGFGEHVE